MPAVLSERDARRSALDRAERLRRLSDLDRDLIRLAGEPGYPRWLAQIKATGGCARPIYLAGHTTTYDASTGEVLRQFDTATEPAGRVAVRCRNRRASRCGPCSQEHSVDTYHLVRAGLSGGKGIPANVADHPRLFITLTAPSFGPVHRAGPERCRPRRDRDICPHGQPVGCGRTHHEADPAIGQPICAACYDYTAHALWHAHAGELWNRTCRAIRRHLATAAGITQADFARHARLSFAKVAEYQRRGAVHFHAVIRLDGASGPDDPAPAWASTTLLADAVRTSAHGVRVALPASNALGEHVFAWGAQLDVRPIRGCTGERDLTDDAVAAYVAKYTSKSVGDYGGLDYPVTGLPQIRHAVCTPHLRVLMATCWRLGGLPELEHLHLRTWAHALGFRGHCLTKSRGYSTTYRALRTARAQFQAGSAPTCARSVTVATWRYVGSGHTRGAAAIAAGIAEDLAELRALRHAVGSGGYRDG